jgi:small-conductance mechanosensitive channel
VEPWERFVVVGVVLAVTAGASWLIDRAIAKRELNPEARTRYRVLRRTVLISVLVVGILSALLVIPQVRFVAGGVLASSAVLAVVIGFAAQRTLGNAVAGILIAFTQPLRLGDVVEIGGTGGTVEEIGLTYTWIRTDDNDRLAVPNEKLASDTIRNSTIVSPEKVAEITVHVPLSQDLGSVVELLREEIVGEVAVTALNGDATLTIRAPAADETSAERVEQELRLRVHERLRAAGIWP